MLYQPKLTICLTGELASGKGEISKVMDAYFSMNNKTILLTFSDPLKDELKLRKIPINRDSLRKMGNKFRKARPESLARKLHHLITPKIDVAILDGARNPAEIKYLRNKLNAFILAIKANQKIRLERYLSRNKIGDSHELFYITESIDKGDQQPAYGQQVAKCLEMADYTFWNNFRTIEELKKNVHNFLKSTFGDFGTK